MLQGIGGQQVAPGLRDIELYAPAIVGPGPTHEQPLFYQGSNGLGRGSLRSTSRVSKCRDSTGAFIRSCKVPKRLPLGRVQTFRKSTAVAASGNAGEKFCDCADSHDRPSALASL